jgi:hypothetical protein
VPSAAGSTLGIWRSNPDRLGTRQLEIVLDNLDVCAQIRGTGNTEYPTGDFLPVGPKAASTSENFAHLILPFLGHPG